MYLNKLQNTVLNIGQILIIKSEIEQDVTSYDTYASFLENNKGKGILKIRVFTANKVLPLKNVHIVISKVIGTDKVIFFEGDTNDSGVVNEIELPALSKFTSLVKEVIYLAECYHQNYIKETPSIVSMYDGIKSILEIEMIPKGDN